MKHDEIIEKYFSNQLSESERLQFDQLLTSDQKFKETFTFHQNLQLVAKAHEKKVLKKRLQTLEAEAFPPNDSPKSTLPLWQKWGMAAVILLLIGLLCYFFFFSTDRSEKLYAQYYESFPNSYAPVLREEASLDDQAISFLLYENQQYLQASKRFEQLDSEDPNVKFYQAMSLLELKEFQKAGQIFDAIKSSNSKYQAAIYWYSALCNIQQNNWMQAQTDLAFLQSNYPDFKTSEVSQLYLQISN